MNLQVEQNRISPVEIELKVQVPAEEMVDRLEKAIQTLMLKAKVPGFRAGKIPRNVVVQKYGQALTQETVSQVLQEAYKAALQEANIEPISPGDLHEVDFKEGTPLTFKAKIEVLPEFELPNMTDLSVELQSPTVEEEDIQTALDGLRESHAVLVPTDDPIDIQSVVTVDFQEIDHAGVPLIGQNQKDVDIDMGRHRFGQEFADKLTGLKAGDETIVTFQPTPEQGEGVKPMSVQVKVQNVQRKELPVLDDDFARSVNQNADSLEALKTDLKGYILSRASHRAREIMLKSLMDELLKRSEFPVPPNMMEDYLQRMAEDFSTRRRNKSIPFNIEEFKQEHRATAVYNLRWYLLRKKIIADQQLTVSKEDYETELGRYALIENKTVDEIKKSLSHDQTHQVKDDLMERKVIAYLESQVQTIPKTMTLAEFEGRAGGALVTE